MKRFASQAVRLRPLLIIGCHIGSDGALSEGNAGNPIGLSEGVLALQVPASPATLALFMPMTDYRLLKAAINTVG
jgi:hypothetical protein